MIKNQKEKEKQMKRVQTPSPREVNVYSCDCQLLLNEKNSNFASMPYKQ
jgi:hypothetical protein